MAWSLIAHAGSNTPGTSGCSTSAIDTTGADLLVVCASQFSGSTPGAVSDSKGNTWTGLTAQSGAGGTANAYARMFYVQGGTVGAGHTFTYSGGFSSFAVLAFSGSAASPFDVENGAVDPLFHGGFSPGSVTPSQNGSLIVTGTGPVDGGTTPYFVTGAPFTVTDYVGFGFSSPDGQEGVGGAYMFQTTAATVTPTWNWTTGALKSAAVIAVFKPAAGGGVFPVALSDTAASSDSVSAAALMPQSLHDTAATSDALFATLSGGGIFPFSFSDTATTSDALAAAAAVMAKALTDSAASSDALGARAVMPFALADSASSADAVRAAAIIGLADSAASSDSLTATARMPQALSDSATSFDILFATIQGGGTFAFAFSDAAASSDSFHAALSNATAFFPPAVAARTARAQALSRTVIAPAQSRTTRPSL
jgi:hypothetical protein